jgi:hypothetical protein
MCIISKHGVLLVKPLVLEFDEKAGKAQSTLDIIQYPVNLHVRKSYLS